jgi:hypothetical protein
MSNSGGNLAAVLDDELNHHDEFKRGNLQGRHEIVE